MKTTVKERMVTRTIKSTIVKVNCFNKKTREFTEEVRVFTGKFDTSDENNVLPLFNTLELRAIEITEVKVHEEKWAIPERLFLQYGHRITKEEEDAIEEFND